MKLLKLCLLAMILAFMMMSCEDDSTSPNDDKDFTIITEEQPLNIIIKTYNDDVLIDTVRIYKEISEMLPDGIYYWSEYLTNQNVINLRFFHHPESASEFDLYLEFESKSFIKGNYSLSHGASGIDNYYYNPIFTSQYSALSGNLLITDVKHFENTENKYFISGEINSTYKKNKNENHTTRVKVIFENMEIYLKTFDYEL